MIEASKTSSSETCEDSSSATSSPGSESGPTPCASPAGRTLDLFGQEVAPVPLSQQQEKLKPAHNAVERTLSRTLDELASSYAAFASTNGLPTGGTYGRNCGASSGTADLTRSLGNRLRLLMAGCGSPLFELRWKFWHLTLGPRISALRASVRLTFDNDFGSLPTPLDIIGETESGTSNPSRELAQPGSWPTPNGDDANNATWASGEFSSLTRTATWATPSSRDYKDSPGMAQESFDKSGKFRNRIDQLARQAHLSAWPTPNAMAGGQTSRGGDRKDELLMGGLLSPRTRLQDRVKGRRDLIKMTGNLDTPVRGEISNGSTAETESIGQLNPAFSLWLMGLPDAWVSCGERAMRSLRKSRKRS